MLTAEERFLVMSKLRAGLTVPQIHVAYPELCTITTLQRLAKDFSAGVENKPKTKRKQPWRTDPKMAARVIHRLTVARTAHSIPSVARGIGMSHRAVHDLQKKKGVECSKIRKRNLIRRRNSRNLNPSA